MQAGVVGTKSGLSRDYMGPIVKEDYIPDYWRKITLVPVYKGKGDPQSY